MKEKVTELYPLSPIWGVDIKENLSRQVTEVQPRGFEPSTSGLLIQYAITHANYKMVCTCSGN